MEKKYLKLLNDFANDHVLATDIQVEIGEYHKTFKPRMENSYARYEDANLLGSIIMGAENLCWYLSRNGYEIIKKRK